MALRGDDAGVLQSKHLNITCSFDPDKAEHWWKSGRTEEDRMYHLNVHRACVCVCVGGGVGVGEGSEVASSQQQLQDSQEI